MSICDGCLGSRRCWVCLGTGELATTLDTARPCHRCAATGLCSLCRGDLPTGGLDDERDRARFERLIILASDG